MAFFDSFLSSSPFRARHRPRFLKLLKTFRLLKMLRLLRLMKAADGG